MYMRDIAIGFGLAYVIGAVMVYAGCEMYSRDSNAGRRMGMREKLLVSLFWPYFMMTM